MNHPSQPPLSPSKSCGGDASAAAFSHWTSISKDPNCPQVQQWRADRLGGTRSSRLIADRIQHLCGLARGRKVLDVGCVEHFAEAEANPLWLHGHLARAAASCLGVDILAESLQQLRAKGYNVRLANVLDEPLTEQFELIVCGEMIEHIGTPGRLFQNVARMLVPGGVFALTTPFPWYLGWMVKNLFNGGSPIGSVDHVAWYDPCTLAELGERCGLRLRFYAGIRDPETSFKLRLVKTCLGPLTRLGLRPEILTRSLLYEFVRTDSAC